MRRSRRRPGPPFRPLSPSPCVPARRSSRSHHILSGKEEGRRSSCDNSCVDSAELAINGGPKVRKRPYPPWPAPGAEDAEAVTEVLRSGKLTQLTGGAVAACAAA